MRMILYSVIKCGVVQGEDIAEMKSVLRFFSSKVLLYIDLINLEFDFLYDILLFSFFFFSIPHWKLFFCS